jgi:hypothetical protein
MAFKDRFNQVIKLPSTVLALAAPPSSLAFIMTLFVHLD